MNNHAKKLMAEVMANLQLKADMFDYLCWLEQATSPEEIKNEHLCLASDGTTCWGKTYAEAVRVAMEHDKGIQDAADAQQPNTEVSERRAAGSIANREAPGASLH